jgi:hypothetical protein
MKYNDCKWESHRHLKDDLFYQIDYLILLIIGYVKHQGFILTNHRSHIGMLLRWRAAGSTGFTQMATLGAQSVLYLRYDAGVY